MNTVPLLIGLMLLRRDAVSENETIGHHIRKWSGVGLPDADWIEGLEAMVNCEFVERADETEPNITPHGVQQEFTLTDSGLRAVHRTLSALDGVRLGSVALVQQFEPTILNACIGQKIKQRREELGLSAVEVANLLDPPLRRDNYLSIEAGENSIKGSHLFQMSEIFDMPINGFLETVDLVAAAVHGTRAAIEERPNPAY